MREVAMPNLFTYSTAHTKGLPLNIILKAIQWISHGSKSLSYDSGVPVQNYRVFFVFNTPPFKFKINYKSKKAFRIRKVFY